MNASTSPQNVEIIKCQPKAPLVETPNPKFGTVFSPHMLKMDISTSDFSNIRAEIKPYDREPMYPSCIAIHYGQSIFEGMKAFRQKDGSVGIFRLDLHAKRFRRSCQLMSMTEIPEDVFTQCLLEYVRFEKDSVPSLPDHALYLRPVLFGSDPQIKMGRSATYSFYILASVAGNYFHGRSSEGAKVLVNREFVRAYPGGLGEAKTAANYAASLGPLSYAASLGCDQLLFLSAVDHDHVDEMGGMNFFVVRDGELVTPPLLGTILDGVTRRSILEIAKTLGMTVKEEPLSFSQLMKDIDSGKVTECFACGTAAVVQPLSELLYQDKRGGETSPIPLPKGYPVALRLREQLQKIQRGEHEAPGAWLSRV